MQDFGTSEALHLGGRDVFKFDHTMAVPVPKDNDTLAPWSEGVIHGYKENHEEWGVPISFADEAEAARIQFLGLDASFRRVAAELSETLIPAASAADEVVERLIRASNKVIGLKVGDRFNETWADAGHQNQTTRIPERPEDRLILAGKLVTFYEQRPDWQVEALGLTATKLQQAVTAAESANKAVKAKELEKSKLLRSCNAAAGRLRTRLRMLIAEAKQVLGRDDPRWKTMGLSTPASHRATKETRDRKAQARTQSRLERSAFTTRNRAHQLKASADKNFHRADQVEVTVKKIKEQARQFQMEADALFLKADELDQRVKEGAAALRDLTLPTPRSSTNPGSAAPASSDSVSLSS